MYTKKSFTPSYSIPAEDCTGVAGMPCDENAMCEELCGRDNFTCTCIPPYVGDGFTCSRGKYLSITSVLAACSGD